MPAKCRYCQGIELLYWHTQASVFPTESWDIYRCPECGEVEMFKIPLPAPSVDNLPFDGDRDDVPEGMSW